MRHNETCGFCLLERLVHEWFTSRVHILLEHAGTIFNIFNVIRCDMVFISKIGVPLNYFHKPSILWGSSVVGNLHMHVSGSNRSTLLQGSPHSSLATARRNLTGLGKLIGTVATWPILPPNKSSSGKQSSASKPLKKTSSIKYHPIISSLAPFSILRPNTAFLHPVILSAGGYAEAEISQDRQPKVEIPNESPSSPCKSSASFGACEFVLTMLAHGSSQRTAMHLAAYDARWHKKSKTHIFGALKSVRCSKFVCILNPAFAFQQTVGCISTGHVPCLNCLVPGCIRPSIGSRMNTTRGRLRLDQFKICQVHMKFRWCPRPV